VYSLAKTQMASSDIEVFPNYIDLSLYSHIAHKKDSFQVNIGHFGSSSHFTSLVSEDFVAALDQIMQEYPNVTFTTIGSHFGEFKMRWGARYIQKFGASDIYSWVKDKYPGFVDDIDFFVTPLVDNVYNRCKSATKFNEVSSSRRPGVWQDIRQYRDVVVNGKNGMLAGTQKEWYTAMKTLIDDKLLRLVVGEEAYKTVKNYWTIQEHVESYAKFFKSIV
jgi:glycosyltransferase involved in cell wall biosynthesis